MTVLCGLGGGEEVEIVVEGMSGEASEVREAMDMKRLGLTVERDPSVPR